MEDGFLDALALLTAIVVEKTEGIAAQQDNGYKVAGREKGHEQVDDVPHQLETGKRSEDDHQSTRAKAIECHYKGVGRNETDVGFAIIVIADNAGKRKEEDGNGHKYGTSASNLRLKGRLRERYY